MMRVTRVLYGVGACFAQGVADASLSAIIGIFRRLEMAVKRAFVNKDYCKLCI